MIVQGVGNTCESLDDDVIFFHTNSNMIVCILALTAVRQSPEQHTGTMQETAGQQQHQEGILTQHMLDYMQAAALWLCLECLASHPDDRMLTYCLGPTGLLASLTKALAQAFIQPPLTVSPSAEAHQLFQTGVQTAHLLRYASKLLLPLMVDVRGLTGEASLLRNVLLQATA